MVSIENYVGREQSYVKHRFLESYLEGLAYKVASSYPHIVYVDGFAGPWQSANEEFKDTSFGIALNALRQAKDAWEELGRSVNMTAYLVERDTTAYRQLSRIQMRYPDIQIRTYNADFLDVLDEILGDLPNEAFAFFLIDPKGWRLPLMRLKALLLRQNSEVVFNFMLDFINRAVNMREPAIVAGLDELIPYGDWRAKLKEAEERGNITPDDRKAILVDGFGTSLKELGRYEHVAETTVLRPVRDRPLYCLFYATRHPKGIEVFRDCQISALREESKTRASAKVRHVEATTGQGEIFESLHDMAPEKLSRFLDDERRLARETLLELAPSRPHFLPYADLWPQVLARHVVRRTDVNRLAAQLYRDGLLLFPDWEARRKVPQQHYRIQRAQ